VLVFLAAGPIAGEASPSWQSVASLAVGGAVAVVSGLVVALYQTRVRRIEAEDAYQRDQRGELIAVLAPLQNLLADMYPARLALSANQALLADINERQRRWTDRGDQVAVAG
jgi:hypothetical protein